ncbi:MAG TPA: tRNA epoxyqueuosine(34) reductase QueG [Planctomycetota bacterium]|nr:tRNA epoxyqueuosine(34) reductase QueG [Planctomycetota bacterium]
MERAEDTIDSGHATGPAPTPFTSPLKDHLRRRARELGLDEVGFTTADDLPRADYVERWLAEGRAGAMSYLARGGPRHRPGLLLEGARTIVVGAARYQRPRREPSHVAAYAQRGDYHPGLRKALRPLAAELRAAVAGSATKICIDAAPILEREAAARAGVGWIGKNTLVVHKEHGCYTLLGLILWTGELPPDPPAVDHCGGCRRCLDACPTQALTAPYQMDATRCLSYLTIEQRDAIPVEYRAALGVRAFGCDACLAACPYGGAALFEDAPLLPTDPALAGASLRDLLERARDRFWKSFRATPVERARRRGFLRNLLVAAGNSRDASLREVVLPFRDDGDTLVAEHADWALRRLDEGRDPVRASTPTEKGTRP